MSSLGQTLKEAREQQGYSLEDVEKATRIGKRYVAALEAEEYGRLPSPVYVRGFIRLYAQFLGLDVESILALYPERFSRAIGPPPPAALARPALPIATWAVIALFLAAVASIGFFLYRSGLLAGNEGGDFALQLPTATVIPSAEGASPIAGTSTATAGVTGTPKAGQPSGTATPAQGSPTPASTSTAASTATMEATSTASSTTTPPSTATSPATPTRSATATTSLPMVVVPYVVGQEFEAARGVLFGMGLQVQRVEASQDGFPAEQVLSQNPPAGSQLPRGQSVSLTVNAGTKKISVPDVVRLPEQDARQKLQAAGLRPNPFSNYRKLEEVPWAPKDICVGCVLSTTPGGWDMVDPGTEVFLAVRAP